MQRITYYVAMSLDDYIAGPDEDISGFIQSGPGVDRYFQDLQQFQTVIMGRKTYEFGYRFGLKPGAAPYPWAKNIVFSSSLHFDEESDVETTTLSVENIERIKKESDTDIYLCGGGDLANWLLEEKQIDMLKVKLNPLILGQGTKLFGKNEDQYRCDLVDREGFSDGLQILNYNIHYHSS